MAELAAARWKTQALPEGGGGGGGRGARGGRAGRARARWQACVVASVRACVWQARACVRVCDQSCAVVCRKRVRVCVPGRHRTPVSVAPTPKASR
jgi:hypothetical protein